jgi:hypothetical protein
MAAGIDPEKVGCCCIRWLVAAALCMRAGMDAGMVDRFVLANAITMPEMQQKQRRSIL